MDTRACDGLGPDAASGAAWVTAAGRATAEALIPAANPRAPFSAARRENSWCGPLIDLCPSGCSVCRFLGSLGSLLGGNARSPLESQATSALGRPSALCGRLGSCRD